MRPEELMIGDYVRVNRDGLCIKKDTTVEIREIDANNRFANHIGCASCRPLDDMQYENGIWCDYLSPILLITKILEKNGFVYTDPETTTMSEDKVWQLKDDYNQVLIEIEEQTDENLLDYYIGYFSCGANSSEIYFRYVHQLQHALKLCGIAHEITL